jgi:hypothetical protein
MIRKLPFADRVVHGYNVVAVTDVNDVEALGNALAAIVAEPRLAAEVGARARRLTVAYQRDSDFPGALETALAEAAARGRSPAGRAASGRKPASRRRGRSAPHLPSASAADERLFRLSTAGWALAPGEILGLAPSPATTFRIASLSARSRGVRKRADVAEAIIDVRAAEILRLCDGSHTVAEIAALTAADRCADPAELVRVSECVLRHLELGVLKLGPPARAHPSASPTRRRSRKPN